MPFPAKGLIPEDERFLYIFVPSHHLKTMDMAFGGDLLYVVPNRWCRPGIDLPID